MVNVLSGLNWLPLLLNLIVLILPILSLIGKILAPVSIIEIVSFSSYPLPATVTFTEIILPPTIVGVKTAPLPVRVLTIISVLLEYLFPGFKTLNVSSNEPPVIEYVKFAASNSVWIIPEIFGSFLFWGKISYLTFHST